MSVTEIVEEIIVHPIGGRIGAEITGLGRVDRVAETAVATIRAALLRHKVVFIRGQFDLTDAAQERFAARLGDLVPHPTVSTKDGSDYLLELDSRYGGATNSWHTDVTFVPAYPAFSVLRAVQVPETGGDTLWANTVSAYEALPAPLKPLTDTLWALHTNDCDYASPDDKGGADTDRMGELTRRIFETEHPVVRIHPETGERSLVLGHFVRQFVGLGRADSVVLLNILQNHITRAENVVRWRWKAGDLAIWDNRATQHYASHDYDERRIMQRATVAGEAPVAIDGRKSIARAEYAPIDRR